MSEKFTKGPWFQELRPCEIGCCDDMCDIAAMYPGDDEPKRYIATVNGGNAVWLRAGETEWNRHLIAASPDLYAALKYARRFLNAQDHEVAFVDAALKKAVGE